MKKYHYITIGWVIVYALCVAWITAGTIISEGEKVFICFCGLLTTTFFFVTLWNEFEN